ncbi:IclR family transcriptional regulator [Halogeometricum sp. S1BR25-6]|uniref:IclR family transcriptional regulator n=1 Tax=Halogeometricum salsisoli TaxID=2950536 RepID=A0ABU2GCC5_9EURY|nr:IclR family transcriptional regulator [Halogeometricum sp. S1BR25-6]MDS0297913.1 IclR family transcriptional regulator [Halogeometricum sp. S1BR25-6]
MTSETGTKRIEASERTLEILGFLAGRERTTATEVAEHLGVAKSTTHYHLKTLEDAEFVVRDREGYRVSLNLLTMGHDVVSQMATYQAGKAKVDELARETGELCILMVEEHGYGFYIYDNRGEGAVNFDTAGNRKRLHDNALGKAFLSQAPPERVDEIVDRHGLPATTRQTITDRDRLDAELEQARSEGVAFDYEEQLNGLCCVAAPIRDTHSEGVSVRGAISVAVPASRAQDEYFTEELRRAVSDAANIIELDLQEY